MIENVWDVEQAAAVGADEAAGIWLPAAPEVAAPLACPCCARLGTLVRVGEALFCAACGYASESAAGCT